MAGAMGVGRFAYTPLLPDMRETFGWSFAQAGDVASANFVGYMVGAILAQRAATSPEVRLWLAFSFMASVGTTYLGAEANNFAVWLVLRFASGVASAFCLVIVTTQLMQILARSGSERMGNLHFAGVGIGIVVCVAVVALGGTVAGQWANLGAASAAMMACAWFLIGRGSLQPTLPGTANANADVGTYLWRIVIGYGFFGFGYVISATFIAAMAENLIVPVNANGVWLMVGMAMVPSVYLWQWVANRFGLVRALIVAYFIEAIGVFMTAIGDSMTELVIGGVLLGGAFAAITALALSCARQYRPHRVAFAVSAMTTSFALGQLLGPAVAGRLADIFGDFVLSGSVAAALLVASGLLLFRKSSG